MTDEQIQSWLAEHASDLDPEEILFEEEKAQLSRQILPEDGTWPLPQKVPNMEFFAPASSEEGFNRIVGDPNNWETILSNIELYNNWILPNAILLFGKTWFNRIKWRNIIHRSAMFPLFTDQEKKEALLVGGLENTSYGKSRIAKISKKISSALSVYLQGKWQSKNERKNPGWYLVESIKNETIREIGKDLGLRFTLVLACPYCLTSKQNRTKTPLVRHSFKQYVCPRCKELSENLELNISNLSNQGKLEEAEKTKILYEKVKRFSYFIGITCVCPNDQCGGKFVPLTCVDYDSFNPRKHNFNGVLKKFAISQDIQSFKKPPSALGNFPLTCPFCDTKFTPSSALKMRSGFKKMSGHLTGLPTISIWTKPEIYNLDESVYDSQSTTNKDIIISLPQYSLTDKIGSEQRLSMLIGEITIKMAKINKKSSSGLVSWFFYKAVISWIKKYKQDADGYFFGWSSHERDMTAKEKSLYPGQTKKKMTNIRRGTSVAIHFSLFKEWLDILEKNIKELYKVDPNIKDIKDLSWFCSPPKFSSGPKTSFISRVDSHGKIANLTRVRAKNSHYVPRMAKVYAIYKIQNNIVHKYVNYIEDIDIQEWQSICLSPSSSLKPGDEVKVEALVMSGHPTHAPIQRMLRLRSVVLNDIINRILDEEKSGTSNTLFWESWRNRVKSAKVKVGENLGE